MISLAHINYCFIGAKINRKLETTKGFCVFRHVMIEKKYELVVLGHEFVEMRCWSWRIVPDSLFLKIHIIKKGTEISLLKFQSPECLFS